MAFGKLSGPRFLSPDVRGSFTPLISSAEGHIHKEFASFHKRFSETLAWEWSKPYSKIIERVRIQSQNYPLFAQFHYAYEERGRKEESFFLKKAQLSHIILKLEFVICISMELSSKL